MRSLSLRVADRPGQIGRKISPAVEAALFDQLEGVTSRTHVCFGGIGQQPPQVIPVLRSVAVVSRQDLEGDEVSAACDGQRQLLQEFEFFGVPDDLSLDTRRREEEIDENVALCLSNQSYGSDAPGALLLE